MRLDKSVKLTLFGDKKQQKKKTQCRNKVSSLAEGENQGIVYMQRAADSHSLSRCDSYTENY